MSFPAIVGKSVASFLRDAPNASALAPTAVGIDTPSDTMATMTGTLTTTASALVASATTTANAAAEKMDDGGSGECRLLGPFALIIQIALGALALLSLVYKRWRERPQRPVKIWFFDVSKQVVGSVLVHIANVFLSMLTSGRFDIKVDPADVQAVQRLLRRDDKPYIPNPCSFYLLNLAIDTTVGIPILLVLLKIVTGLVAYTPFGKPAESIQSGYYGRPPNAWWWLKQSIIYFCGLFGMKICVLILFLILPWISKLGDWALQWTDGNEHLQIFFVMMLFPLIMNGLQYYIIDSFIKKNDMEHESVPTEESGEVEPLNTALMDSDEDDDDDKSDSGESRTSMKLSGSRSFEGRQDKTRGRGLEEYDPDLDGHTVVGSSRSQQERTKISQKSVPPE